MLSPYDGPRAANLTSVKIYFCKLWSAFPSRKLMYATDKSPLTLRKLLRGLRWSISVCVSASVHFHQTQRIDNQHPFRTNVFAIAFQRVN